MCSQRDAIVLVSAQHELITVVSEQRSVFHPQLDATWGSFEPAEQQALVSST